MSSPYRLPTPPLVDAPSSGVRLSEIYALGTTERIPGRKG